MAGLAGKPEDVLSLLCWNAKIKAKHTSVKLHAYTEQVQRQNQCKCLYKEYVYKYKMWQLQKHCTEISKDIMQN